MGYLESKPSFFLANCVTSRKLLNPNVLNILFCKMEVTIGLWWLLYKFIHTKNLESASHIGSTYYEIAITIIARTKSNEEERQQRKTEERNDSRVDLMRQTLFSQNTLEGGGPEKSGIRKQHTV